MATYAVGDLQGCLDPLRALLDAAQFDPIRDRLWLVGDLVNRGHASLETLRYLRGLGDAAVTVLGNHDLHLPLVVGGLAATKDTWTRSRAPDLDDLVAWLRTRPLVHFDPALDAVLVHAGVPHLFSLDTALGLAREVEHAIAGPDAPAFFEVMYGNEPAHWDPGLSGHDRLRVAVNYFTRMRFLYPDGTLSSRRRKVLRLPGGLRALVRRAHPDSPGGGSFGHWAARGARCSCPLPCPRHGLRLGWLPHAPAPRGRGALADSLRARPRRLSAGAIS